MIAQAEVFSDARRQVSGYAAIVGGILGLLLAPVMVTIKYMTGWDIVPEPAWVGTAQGLLGGLLQFAAPPVLWTVYGSFYTLALILMLVGLLGVSNDWQNASDQVATKGHWVVVLGLCLVIPGDAIHTWTWHQNGLTIPTPGTNPLANSAYAVHMIGMNVVMVGAGLIGVAGLRRKFTTSWISWMFLMVFPAAVVASLTFLPTTPSGALWLFCVAMIACGYFLLMTDRPGRVVAA